MLNNLNACVIGGGIHGMTTAIALAEAGVNVTVIEKNSDIFQGTSGSTHNRAHIGYHYPRSKETAEECISGLRYFQKKYPEALQYPKEMYYLIAKNSKTTVESFKNFCDDMKFPYELILPSAEFINADLIDNGFKVCEPIFNIFKIKSLFETLAKEKHITIYKSTHFSYFDVKNGQYEITCNRFGDVTKILVDIVINATYAYSNNTLKILDLEEDMCEYELQRTEVAILRSEKYVPSLTVMDGPYVSLMPYAATEPNLYLLYDVVNSVIDKEMGYMFEDKICETNVHKMLQHCNLFFPFELEYVDSLYGSRPIPASFAKNIGDCRKTRIK